MMNTVNSNSCLNKLSAVGREELKVAIKVASYWLTAKLKGRTDRGPLSEASLGEPARLYFLKRACVSLWSGDWKWKPELKLSTQLIRIMKSDMSHVIRDWYKRDVPKKVYLEEYIVDPVDESKLRMEIVAEMQAETRMKSLAYEIARKVIGADKKLHTYLGLVKNQMSYREIALKMKLKMADVKELESKLLLMLKERKDEAMNELFYYKKEINNAECV